MREIKYMLETEERFKEADTDYQKKRGVKRIGHHEIYDAARTKDGIKICSDTITTWYFNDKEPEQIPSMRMCVTVPEEFFSKLKEELEAPAEQEAKHG